MTKKISNAIFSIILIGVILTMSACVNNTEEFDYESLYDNKRQDAYELVDKDGTNRASYGYTNNSRQGYNNWYYMFDDGAVKQMEFSASNSRFVGGSSYIDQDIMYSTAGETSLRMYDISCGGNIVIYGNYKSADSASKPCTVRINLNGQVLYVGSLSGGDVIGRYFEVQAQVEEGDKLYFELVGRCAISFNPVVTYTNAQEESLYHLTSNNKYYGDVFPYYDYDNRRMYMWYLQSDDASGGQYNNEMDISDNMLTYRYAPEVGNHKEWEKYKQDYRFEWIYDCRNFVETKYTHGIRDHKLYKDEKNDRLLLISGNYYSFDQTGWNSDLVIRASDDSVGFGWSKPSVVVDTYRENNTIGGYPATNRKNLPECPSLFRIGDRWYPMVSVAYNTAHQVGPLQYWTGSKNVDCMDEDWSSRPIMYLDGEDLCAARVTEVGEKHYMWGWIPRTYDTMPWAPWGGYLNLPREVIQLSDGSLGSRMDPALTKLLNYGNIFSLYDNNYTTVSGSNKCSSSKLNMNGNNNFVSMGGGYDRNLVTFDLELDQGEAGYVMQQEGNQYRIVVSHQGEDAYLKILSPNDSSHTVNSFIKIRKSDKYAVKIVTDGEFVEFFVNDQYALCGHTAMTGDNYTAMLYSDGDAVFGNVMINKLTPYGEFR